MTRPPLPSFAAGLLRCRVRTRAPSRLFGTSVLMGAVLATLLASTGCDDTEKRLVELSNQGVQALQDQDYRRAEDRFREALKVSPNDADSLYYLGTIALRNGQFKDAADLLQKSIAQDPKRPDAHLSLAKSLYDDHRPDEAKKAVAALHALDAGHPQGHFLLARIALDSSGGGQPDRKTADAALRAAIGGDPGFAPAYQLMAQLYTEVGAFDAARAVLQEGLRFSPNSVELQEGLGLAWIDLGQPAKAKEALTRASAMARARPAVFLNLASALLALGEKDAAIDALKTFIVQSQGTTGQRGQRDQQVQDAADMILRLRGQK